MKNSAGRAGFVPSTYVRLDDDSPQSHEYAHSSYTSSSPRLFLELSLLRSQPQLATSGETSTVHFICSHCSRRCWFEGSRRDAERMLLWPGQRRGTYLTRRCGQGTTCLMTLTRPHFRLQKNFCFVLFLLILRPLDT